MCKAICTEQARFLLAEFLEFLCIVKIQVLHVNHFRKRCGDIVTGYECVRPRAVTYAADDSAPCNITY